MEQSKTTIRNLLYCSCCGEPAQNNRTVLSNQIEFLIENKLPWYAWNDWAHKQLSRHKDTPIADFLTEASNQPNLHQLLNSNHFQWACDSCILQGHAIEATIGSQLFSTRPPYLAYYDKVFSCERCKNEFLFKKEEQQFWYQEMKFWVQSFPKQCLKCRKEIRKENENNDKLSELLKTLDNNDFDEIMEVSRLYLELGKVEKAKHYRKLAEKVMKK